MEKQFIKILVSEYDRMKMVYMKEPELTINQTIDQKFINGMGSLEIKFIEKEFDIINNGIKIDTNFNWNNFIASFLTNNIKEFIRIQGVSTFPTYTMQQHNYPSPYTTDRLLVSSADLEVVNTVRREIYKLFHKINQSMDPIIYISPTTEENHQNLIGMIRKFHNVNVLYNEYLPLDEIFITMDYKSTEYSNFIGFQYTKQSTNETYVLIDSPMDQEKALKFYSRIKF